MEHSPELGTLRQPLLTHVKERYNEILLVGQHLASGTCVACQAPEQLFQTKDGEAEYKKTGICEQCWDALTDNKNDDASIRAQCNALTEPGIEFARQWIELQMCRDSVTMSCQAAVLLAIGAMNLPKMRVS